MLLRFYKKGRRPMGAFSFPSSWAFLLMGVGIMLLFWGVRRGTRAAQQLRKDPPKALGIVRGFRIAVIGLCLGAYGAGWWWRLDWLMTVAIVICLEEIAESSFYIVALKQESTS
jgi:hypothetical protein